jgi:NADH-quinone oxidoreductase subunit N
VAVYLRWLAVLFQEADAGAGTSTASPRRAPRGPLAALALSGAALVLASVAPQLVLGLVS